MNMNSSIKKNQVHATSSQVEVKMKQSRSITKINKKIIKGWLITKTKKAPHDDFFFLFFFSVDAFLDLLFLFHPPGQHKKITKKNRGEKERKKERWMKSEKDMKKGLRGEKDGVFLLCSWWW